MATYQASLPKNTPVVLPTLVPTSSKVIVPTAAIPTLSPTPAPTPTPIVVVPVTSADGIQYYAGDHAKFTSQTPGDWPILKPDQMIAVSWTFLNDGSTTWNSDYSVRWVGGYKVWGNTQVQLMRVVESGESGSAAIDVFAPGTKGNYITYWALFNADGKKLYQVYFAFVVR